MEFATSNIFYKGNPTHCFCSPAGRLANRGVTLFVDAPPCHFAVFILSYVCCRPSSWGHNILLSSIHTHAVSGKANSVRHPFHPSLIAYRRFSLIIINQQSYSARSAYAAKFASPLLCNRNHKSPLRSFAQFHSLPPAQALPKRYHEQKVRTPLKSEGVTRLVTSSLPSATPSLHRTARASHSATKTTLHFVRSFLFPFGNLFSGREKKRY